MIVAVILAILLTWVPSGGVFSDDFLLIFFILVRVALLIALFYLVRILMWFNEKTAVIVAYSMFLCLITITTADAIFPAMLKGVYFESIDTLTEVVSLLVAYRSFAVKAAPIATPFKIFGTGTGMVAGPYFITMLFNPSNDRASARLEEVGLFITFIAICIVLKRSMNFLKHGEEQPVVITGE